MTQSMEAAGARSVDEASQIRGSNAAALSMFQLLLADLRHKARWFYERDDTAAILKVLCTDGTAAMVIYRIMQWARRHRIVPLELLANRLNSICCGCIIGRGAEFGPGFVLIHAIGVVINGEVTGGSNLLIEHQVTIGADRRRSPRLGSNILVGAGAKIIGGITIGDDARIGANAVVVHDVPPHTTVVGIPARVVRDRRTSGETGRGPSDGS